MAFQSSFTAEPSRRYAAFVVDTVTTFVLFLIVGTVADQLHHDLARWDVFAAVFVLYQGTLVVTNQGQTFGRYVANIMVCSDSGGPLTAARSFARALVRALPLVLLEGPSFAPVVGTLAMVALVAVESSVLERSPTRQSLADRVARSLVVNLPPPHTHRAPAGPMFSATDAEFGNPPKTPPK